MRLTKVSRSLYYEINNDSQIHKISAGYPVSLLGGVSLNAVNEPLFFSKAKEK
jgi:hypothetical protein